MKSFIFRIVLFFLLLLIVGYWIELKEFDALYFSLTLFFGFILIIDLVGYIVDVIECDVSYKRQGDTPKGPISKLLFKK